MNTVILMGRLTKEPEPNVTQSGIHILRFTLAVDRPKKKDQDTEADFIGCVAFGKTAEVIGSYCHKGQRILIEGRIQTGSYTDKSGNKKYTTEVIVSRMEFIERRSQDQNKPSRQTGASGAGKPDVSFEDMGTVVHKDPEPMEQEEIPF